MAVNILLLVLLSLYVFVFIVQHCVACFKHVFRHDFIYYILLLHYYNDNAHVVQFFFCLYLVETCFRLTLTNRNPPLFCRQGYLNKEGIVGNKHLWQHAREAGLMSNHQEPLVPASEGSFSEHVRNAGAAATSTINFHL